MAKKKPPHWINAQLLFAGALIGVTVFGVALNALFLQIGFKNFFLRGAVTLPMTYLALIGIVRLASLHTLKKYSKDALQNLEEEIQQDSNRKFGGFLLDFLSVFGQLPAELGGGVIGFILAILGVLAALTIICAFFYWISFEGPLIILDTVFELALAAGLVKTLSPNDRLGTYGTILRRTIVPFLGLWLISFLVLMIVYSQCPESVRFIDAIRGCR